MYTKTRYDKHTTKTVEKTNTQQKTVEKREIIYVLIYVRCVNKNPKPKTKK